MDVAFLAEAVLCCAVLCCAVLCCAVWCCVKLCCAALLLLTPMFLLSHMLGGLRCNTWLPCNHIAFQPFDFAGA